jgi:hypothetical protein
MTLVTPSPGERGLGAPSEHGDGNSRAIAYPPCGQNKTDSGRVEPEPTAQWFQRKEGDPSLASISLRCTEP